MNFTILVAFTIQSGLAAFMAYAYVTTRQAPYAAGVIFCTLMALSSLTWAVTP